MKITESDIKKYQEIYFDIYKKPLSREVAFVELNALVNFMETIYKSNNTNYVNENN